jgi:hypothetical protein
MRVQRKGTRTKMACLLAVTFIAHVIEFPSHRRTVAEHSAVEFHSRQVYVLAMARVLQCNGRETSRMLFAAPLPETGSEVRCRAQ